ncbi:LysR family substrate-binding domain-containing protein [Actinomycetospora soli]|uniref:LysR family substrate-binding domain-containing protein n=1 Tax=Actinomycetospora soli TaxID=2893887 RepID=UPI001E3D0A2E|nr:LysR family substrate-binding domain-containing protein [Actinomycetospora soli]MCD2187531.1 substrate-binding domain-containing protein [Actinomycetospora soli]
MTEQSPAFRLGHVPGSTPDKWARKWGERRPHVPLELSVAETDEIVAAVRAGELDAGLVRLPIDRSGLHAIPLYTETSVVVVPKDHVITAAEEVAPDDLADEIVLRPQDDVLDWTDGHPGRAAVSDPATTADAVELVAAGIGVLVLPLSLARLHHRRDLTHRPVVDVPQSAVVLTWPDAENSDDMEEFIGVVRGRTVNSSRTPRREEPAAPRPDRRRPAKRSPRRR